MKAHSERTLARGAVAAGLLAALTMGGAGPAEARYRYDFRSPEVAIWSEPKGGAAQVGVGRPGDGFDSDYSEEHERYQCDDLYDSTLWHHGTDAATGVVGWVPACHVDDPD
ncbi:hypothetical protein ACFFV7_28470 [Nonomuraea spiralis]|uniref:Secreted protein n=1 Tax=Nonomuraea spiralis TaxID=46182 RepID=A0ABV5ILA2_9ACTN|nr:MULTISPECIES: hypothetical protein [Nonomuraea]RSM96616.1 hypothetical protein DMB42_48005 [Nonomuraea sp. WAC 01424]GGT36545.1 hypothetical protein GCM10010176_095950 [Nonomuraea spiralis]